MEARAQSPPHLASVPALLGCRSQGATREETLVNVREAMEAWLEVQPEKAELPVSPSDVELVDV